MQESRPKHQKHAEPANGKAGIKASEAGKTGRASAATQAYALQASKVGDGSAGSKHKHQQDAGWAKAVLGPPHAPEASRSNKGSGGVQHYLG